MDYHYETQPLPNPISYFLHQAPKKFHRCAGQQFFVHRACTMAFSYSLKPARLSFARLVREGTCKLRRGWCLFVVSALF